MGMGLELLVPLALSAAGTATSIAGQKKQEAAAEYQQRVEMARAQANERRKRADTAANADLAARSKQAELKNIQAAHGDKLRPAMLGVIEASLGDEQRQAEYDIGQSYLDTAAMKKFGNQAIADARSSSNLGVLATAIGGAADAGKFINKNKTGFQKLAKDMFG